MEYTRAYPRQEEHIGLPSRWIAPQIPMWQSPEHVSYPLLKVLRELAVKISQNQPDEFGNPVKIP